VFPLNYLLFALGFVMMSPGLILHDDVIQEVLSFIVICCK
jgi:hypothetical protein